MPRIIAGRFTNANLLAIYPAEVPLDVMVSDVAAPHEQLLPEMLRKKRVVFELTARSEREAIEQIIHGSLGTQVTGSTELIEALSSHMPDYVREITAGALLFQAHTAAATEQILCLGISREGMELSGISEPVHVGILPVNPPSVPPEYHLHTLTTVVRIMGSNDMIRLPRHANPIPDVQYALGLSGYRSTD